MKDKSSLPARFHVRSVSQDAVSVLGRLLSNRWFKVRSGNNPDPKAAVDGVKFGLWLKQFNFVRRAKSDHRRRSGRDKGMKLDRLPIGLRTCPPPGVDAVRKAGAAAPSKVYYCKSPACVFCWSRRIAAKLPVLRFAADNQLSA